MVTFVLDLLYLPTELVGDESVGVLRPYRLQYPGRLGIKPAGITG